MAPAYRRADVSWLSTVVPTAQALLDRGEATAGFTVTTRGGHLIVGRVDEAGPDPRFRLTPLGGGRYGLSLYERNRWEPLPYEGTLDELIDVMNSDLAVWATDWPSPHA
jgi:hypothetical protein